jgi:large subunit ribosomal protein L4
MEISQYTQSGNKSTVKIEVKDDIWDVPLNKDLVVQALNVYMDNQQKGTAHTKTRTDVRGGGKKPWAQKGTGRARHGSIRSPLWVGGGVTFGPRSYKKFKKISKKMKKGAMKSVFSQRMRDKQLMVVKKFEDLKKPSTRKIKDLLAELDLTDNKVTIILPSDMDTFRTFLQSCKNLNNIKVCRAIDVNIYDIMDAERLLLSAKSVKQLEDRLS